MQRFVLALALWSASCVQAERPIDCATDQVVATGDLTTFSLPGRSMQPTLPSGTTVAVEAVGAGTEIHRGELVSVAAPDAPDQLQILRVVGLAGDTLGMRGGVLHRNGAAVDEPYLASRRVSRNEEPIQRTRMREWQMTHLVGHTEGYHPDLGEWGPLVVPRGTVFLLGDNRDWAFDSRYWGAASARTIRGVVHSVWDEANGCLRAVQSAASP